VFSTWTSHLDLIQIALTANKISYTRLDGSMSRRNRAAAIDDFTNNPSTTVILVTIGAGGLGLNLTVANKVFVMEPQFNPAAEQQAIDRVHRLGQTREVTNVRFIMRDSFEENMLKQQEKKVELADLAMTRKKIDRAEAAKAKLESLKSLFR
jgi:SNF2 family DNA or RNA helicase